MYKAGDPVWWQEYGKGPRFPARVKRSLGTATYAWGSRMGARYQEMTDCVELTLDDTPETKGMTRRAFTTPSVWCSPRQLPPTPGKVVAEAAPVPQDALAAAMERARNKRG